MEVLLNIPNSNDWATLYPLLERLGITVINTKPLSNFVSQKEKDWEIIMKGSPKENFDDFMKEFEESRQDRLLPFRD
jgi:hypothetical protein